MKKKYLFIILCGIILFGLTGCGNDIVKESSNENNLEKDNSIALKKYEKLENDMVEATKNYLEDNRGLYPYEIGETVEVDVSKLLSYGYIDDFNSSCYGRVIVGKTLSDEYDYVPYLVCGEKYKTVLLYEKLMEDLVTNGEGLYDMSSVVRSGRYLGYDEDGYDLSSNDLMYGYIYRGKDVNNYVKISGRIYRIVKIDSNNDYMLIDINFKNESVFDDRFNSDVYRNTGRNDYNLSRIYEDISSNYTELDDNDMLVTKGTIKNICIGSRSDDDNSSDGSSECSKILKNQYFGLLPIYDYLNASLDGDCYTSTSSSCSKSNYLSFDSYWTQTASNKNTYDVYNVTIYGAKVSKANTIYKYYPVYFVSNRLVYVSGSGTENDPYIVK